MMPSVSHALAVLACLLTPACRSEPAVTGAIAPCSRAELEHAAAELRALPPERAGDRGRLALEALYSNCMFVPSRVGIGVAIVGGEYVSPSRERATMIWELSSDERKVSIYTHTPEFAALVSQLGWSAEITRRFSRSRLASAAIGVDLLLQDSGVPPRDRKTLAWATYAHLGRAANVWSQVRLARTSARGAELEYHGRVFEPMHVHVASQGWSIGVWKPEPSRWLPAHEGWGAPRTSEGPPPTQIEPPQGGVVQMYVAAEVNVAQLRGFIDAIPTPECFSGDCDEFVSVDFVVVSDYHGPDFAELVSLPLLVSARPRPPECSDPDRACVVQLPGREFELSADEQLRSGGRARPRSADLVIVGPDTIEVRSDGASTRIDLVGSAPLAEWVERVFAGAGAATRPAVAIVAQPGVRWQTIVTVVGALQGRQCDVWQVPTPSCRFKQVALWVSE